MAVSARAASIGERMFRDNMRGEIGNHNEIDASSGGSVEIASGRDSEENDGDESSDSLADAGADNAGHDEFDGHSEGDEQVSSENGATDFDRRGLRRRCSQLARRDRRQQCRRRRPTPQGGLHHLRRR